MSFVCTNDKNLITNLEGALFNPIPLKNNLWLPNNIKKLPDDFFENIDKMSFTEISLIVAKNLIGDEIPETDLKNIIEECFNFDIPLHKLNDKTYIFELFHGPTMTFKDVGARFMSKIIKHYVKDETIDIIVSTSGDTGSAVGDAFYNISNIKVHILYPKDKISRIQEFQITNYGKNVIPYEVDGNFDDCQQIIKDTLADKEISKVIKLFPANSINIARLIPQSFYYFWLYAQLKRDNNDFGKLILSVPSGNLGNLTGGVLAYKMGLPIDLFIGATNDNKAFSQYLYENEIKTPKVYHTISNAMDIGIPNNLIRLRKIFSWNRFVMQKLISSYSITEQETKDTIEKVFKDFNYTLDPHTAVGYKALEKHLLKEKEKYVGVVLSTAHPSKFPEVMDKLNVNYKIPNRIKKLKVNGDKLSIPNDYQIWKKMLIKSKNFKNITLIGMPGTGKSYISKKLSELYNWNLLEMDEIIEKKYSLKLIEIINKYGNDNFKKIEEEITMEQKGSNNVFSTGGSIVYSENAINFLRKNSLVVFLNTPLNIIKDRLGDFRKRGIILERGQTIEDLYFNRNKLYNKYCHIKIECNNYDENEICNKINNYFN